MVLIGETYYFYIIDENQNMTIQQFTKLLINSIGFSIFVNSIIIISNYYVNRNKNK